MHFRSVVMGFLTVVSIAAVAAAQAPQTPAPQTPAGGGQRAGGAPPAPFKNLQVLPKDIPRPQLTEIMQAFNAALGVQCAYCHQFVGPGNPGNDMASDEKTPKLVARVMMQMTGDINTRLAANIKKPADQITRVTCATCHRGVTIPAAAPSATPAAPGGTPVSPTAPPAPPR